MKSSATLFLIVGLIVILALIGLVIFQISKMLWGIIQYHRQTRHPLHTLQHSRLGLITSDQFDETLWSGTMKIRGQEILFNVSGNASGPDEQLTSNLLHAANNIHVLEEQALNFLRIREPDAFKSSLELYSLNITDTAHPNNYTLEFTDIPDACGIWQVEFIDNIPQIAGYED
jgi:hypothetical protein